MAPVFHLFCLGRSRGLSAQRDGLWDWRRDLSQYNRMNDDSNQPSVSMYERFRRAAEITADNWRDPQHDLEAIELATPADRRAIEQFMLVRGVRHFVDAEALALLDSPAAREVLREAFRSGTTEIRAAVAHVAPSLVDHEERLAELLTRIDHCDVYQGLNLTLGQIESLHPTEVIVAMLRRIARDPGVAAVHFAGMLLYLHGQAPSPFDWEQRPFLLRFNPGDEVDRRAAVVELCHRIGVASDPYLGSIGG